MVHPIFTESSGERNFNLINVSIMHVQNVLLSLWLDLNRKLLRGYINWSQNSVILFEERNSFIEHSASSINTFDQPVVSLLYVLVLFWLVLISTVEHIKLEHGLAISKFSGNRQVFDSFIVIDVASKTIHEEDTGPVVADDVSLLSTDVVEFGGENFLLCCSLYCFWA